LGFATLKARASNSPIRLPAASSSRLASGRWPRCGDQGVRAAGGHGRHRNSSPKDEREKVFERSYRATRQSVAGARLGLSIVRSVAEAHGASAFLTSSLLRGLHVQVTFPGAAITAPRDQELVRPASLVPTQRLRKRRRPPPDGARPPLRRLVQAGEQWGEQWRR